MTFDQRKLRAFLAVVDRGSLGRAAQTVNMTQPTLSRLIHDMELRMGLPLFERQSKGMVLTDAGESFTPHARLLLFEMEQATEAIAALKGLRRGTVRLGAVAAVTRSLVPKAVARLLKEFPDLRIDMTEAPDGELADGLAARRIDLIIAAELPENDEIVPIAECRFDDVYTVFCSSGHPLARQSSADLERVLGESWIMPKPGSTPRRLFEQLVRQAGYPLPVIAVETGSVGAQVSFVAQGRLLGWLPHPLIESELANGTVRLLTISELMVHRRFFVYRRRRGHLPEAARQMLQFLPVIAARAAPAGFAMRPRNP